MNQIIATAQQILDFKVGNISVGSVIQGLVLLIIFNRIISMIMGPIIDKILGRFKLETTVQGFVKGFIKVILNFVALCVVADSIGIPIASVLAVVGMLGLAISLSVQGALSNVANGRQYALHQGADHRQQADHRSQLGSYGRQDHQFLFRGSAPGGH